MLLKLMNLCEPMVEQVRGASNRGGNRGGTLEQRQLAKDDRVGGRAANQAFASHTVGQVRIPHLRASITSSMAVSSEKG